MAKTKLRFFKLTVLILCVLMLPIFAGCDLVSINVNKQLNEKVASFDNNRVSVTREDLIMMYNSVGNSRFDDSGAPTKDGVEQTVDITLDRAILVDFLTSDSTESQNARTALKVDKITLTTAQSNEVWRNVYKYVNDSVKEYENDLRAEDDADISTKLDTEDSEVKYTPYEKTYELVFNNTTQHYELKKIIKEQDVQNTSIALYDVNSTQAFSELAKTAYNTFRTKYWEQTDSILVGTNTGDTSYSDKAWTKFTNALARNESKRNLSKVTEEIFLRDIQRVYKVYYENEILTVFQQNYTDKIGVTATMAVEKFQQYYLSQYEQFNANPGAFDKLIPTTAEDVYYMQNPSGYFKVNHFLVKFSDKQNKELEKLKTQLSNNQITVSQYNIKVAEVKSQTKAYNRDTKEYEPIDSVYTKLYNAMALATSESQKLAVFREFMYRYNEDDGANNAVSCYYIPTDESKDTMEPNFAKVSRDLFNNGNGKVGDYSSWTETSYGYHVIMYTGPAVAISNTGSVDTIINALNGYYLNPLNNKTMLDQVIEKVTLNTYDSYEQVLLTAIKADKQITKYPSSYNDLY